MDTASKGFNESLGRILILKKMMVERLMEREDEIHTLVLAAITRLHHCQIGPPGAAKTQLFESFVRAIGGANLFIKLMGRNIPLEECFGPTDLAAFREGKLRRIIDGYFPTAHFTCLDEAFKTGDIQLNPFLRGFNERRYRNGDQEVVVPLRTAGLCSNELYSGSALDAFWSRITFRHFVPLVTEKGNFFRMLDVSVEPADFTSAGVTLADLQTVEDALPQIEVPVEIKAALWNLRRELERQNIRSLDDRKAGWIVNRVLPAEALLGGRESVEEEDLLVLTHCLWDKPEQKKTIATILGQMITTSEDEVKRLITRAEELAKFAETARTKYGTSDPKGLVELVRDNEKTLKEIHERITAIRERSTGSKKGHMTRCITRVEEIAQMNKNIAGVAA